jgi:pimeloyl-[acyl-carrier protein] methyl ester esterase
LIPKYRLSFRDFGGDGSEGSIVFVHGWGVGSAVWEEQAGYFKKKFRVVTVDLPGHGKSKPFKGKKNTISLCAELLMETIADLNLDRVTLVGWSLGAEVAARGLLLTGGEDLRSIVLVGGTPCYVAPTDSDDWGMPRAKAKYFKRQLERDFRAVLSVFIHTFFDAEKALTPERIKQIGSLFFDESFPPDEKSAMELLDSLYEVDIRPILAEVRPDLPVLVCHGDRDMIVPCSAVKEWNRLIPGMKKEIFKNCGHAPFLTRPLEFRDSMDNFLSALR